MENSSDIANAQPSRTTTTQAKGETNPAVFRKEEDLACLKQPPLDLIVTKDIKESASNHTTGSVLTERNVENTSNASSANKLVSPVLLKLRRNQERRVTPANPVDPVQVPPKQFRGFPSDRYMSPTDSIMSPVSRGLLARNRRFAKLPPPVIGPPKNTDTIESTSS